MGKERILEIRRDRSIPWFEQIEKTVLLPHHPHQQVFYSIKPADYVTALTVTTRGEFVLLRQYRPVVENYTLELPSGHLEEGESPAEAMIRELREETGCEVDAVTPLGEIVPDTGRLENRLWAFYADDVRIERLPDPMANEGIEVRLMTREEFFRLIAGGKMNHALDLSVIAMAIIKKHLTPAAARHR